jgi:acyl carrier protein
MIPATTPPDDPSRIVKEVIAKVLGIPIAQVTFDARIVEDLGADSLDVVSITMELDERFDLSINDAVQSNLSTVKDLCEFIDKARGES